ncbi:MAG: glycosyl transferase, partial [Kocuria rhizophila]
MTEPRTAPARRIDAVVIGRNEGERLVRCLDSLTAAGLRRVVYVDSGSTDGSVAAAEARGAQVVLLDTAQPFTAARARNAGAAALPAGGDYIQFVDGDCALDPGWIPVASAFLDAHPKVAVACGRRREIAPEASVYNRLIDREWDTPVGEAR